MKNLPSQLRRRRGLVAVVAATFVLAGCGAEGSAEDDSSPDSTPTSQGPTDDPAESDEASEITVAAPVYFVGEAGGKDRLYREFREVRGVTLTEAARLVDGGSALDPDYRTLWPGGTVISAEAGRKVITVELNRDFSSEAPLGMSEREAELAIQQMVMTLQGVEQSRIPVRFVRPDRTPESDAPVDPMAAGPDTLFGIDITEPFRAAKWSRTLAMVNVTLPIQGQSFDRDVLEAEGVASSPEANVPWQILREDEVVLEGFATAGGWRGSLHPWAVSIDVSELPPGDYTFIASTDDPSDGEGSEVTQDSKDFTLS